MSQPFSVSQDLRPDLAKLYAIKINIGKREGEVARHLTCEILKVLTLTFHLHHESSHALLRVLSTL